MTTLPRTRKPYTTYATSHIYGLRRREDEVWGWVAKGYTNQQIASALGITIATAENHVESLLDRLPIGEPLMVRRLRAALLYHGIVTWPSA